MRREEIRESFAIMGQRKRNTTKWKRMGSRLTDARMNGEGSSRLYKGQKLPLEEALMLASTVTRRSSANLGALGKPAEEVRVVPAAAIPKVRLKSASTNRKRSSDDGGNTRAIRQDEPGMGLPWVPGPPKERKPKVAPEKPKGQSKKREKTLPHPPAGRFCCMRASRDSRAV